MENFKHLLKRKDGIALPPIVFDSCRLVPVCRTRPTPPLSLIRSEYQKPHPCHLLVFQWVTLKEKDLLKIKLQYPHLKNEQLCDIVRQLITVQIVSRMPYVNRLLESGSRQKPHIANIQGTPLHFSLSPLCTLFSEEMSPTLFPSGWILPFASLWHHKTSSSSPFLMLVVLPKNQKLYLNVWSDSGSIFFFFFVETVLQRLLSSEGTQCYFSHSCAVISH